MNTVKQKSSIRELAYVGLSAALISVCAWIAVPLPSGISFTMQTFAVCAVSGLFGWKRGLTAVTVYLLIGFVGLPVFSGFRSGAGVLMGATGGYLIGFLVMAPCIGFLTERFRSRFSVLIFSMILGEVLLYLFGTVWFVTVYAAKTGPIGYQAAFAMCVAPYLIPDAVKIALSAILVRRLSPYLKVNTEQ